MSKLSKFSDLPWVRTRGDDKSAAIVLWLLNLFILLGGFGLIYSTDWATTSKWLVAMAWAVIYSSILTNSQWKDIP